MAHLALGTVRARDGGSYCLLSSRGSFLGLTAQQQLKTVGER